MNVLVAFMCITGILFIGEFISSKTNAWIPSVFISGVLFLVGFWTILPHNILELSGISPQLSTLFVYLLITNIGTMLSIKELKEQWKFVLVCLAGMLGAIVLLLSVGRMLTNYNTVIIGTPPLLGGIVSALIMSDAATKVGLTDLSVLAIVIYVMQGFAGYPLTAIVLKREGRNTLKLLRNGQWKRNEEDAKGAVANPMEEKAKILNYLPSAFDTSYFCFLRVAFVAFLANEFSILLKPIVDINAFVMCLIFGIFARYLGFLEKAPLVKANGYGYAILVLMAFVFDGLKQSTPEMLVKLMVPMLVIIGVGVIGIYIFSFIAGKILKVSTNLAFATSLTALYGFPADYILTTEIVRSLATNKEEEDVLYQHMVPPMLVGGFVSVTIVSVVLAGVFVGFIH